MRGGDLRVNRQSQEEERTASSRDSALLRIITLPGAGSQHLTEQPSFTSVKQMSMSLSASFSSGLASIEIQDFLQKLFTLNSMNEQGRVSSLKDDRHPRQDQTFRTGSNATTLSCPSCVKLETS